MKILGERASVKKAERFTSTIVVLSIICIILMSLLPWISVSENDYVKEDLHFNFEMMKKSFNGQINDLARDLNLINILFWCLIILGLISFLGATIHALGKFSILGYILLLVGGITFILSLLLLNFQFAFLEKVANIESISASAPVSAFYYAYFLIIISFIILIFSISYTFSMTRYSIQKFRILNESKLDKKPKKRIVKKLIKKVSNPIEEKQLKIEEPEKEVEISKPEPQLQAIIPKEETVAEPDTNNKQDVMEQWLVGEFQSLEKQEIEEESSKSEIIDKPSSLEEDTQELQKESKEAHVFAPEKTKVKSGGADDVQISKSFEKALSSAIKKKQNEIEKLEPFDLESEIEEKESKDKKESDKKKYNVRCPQCKHIFTFNKGDKATKIKCPICGKKGIIK